MIAFEGNRVELKPVEYWVRDKGNGFSDLHSEYGMFPNLDNDVLVPMLCREAAELGHVVHLPDKPLSMPKSWVSRLTNWLFPWPRSR